MRSAEPLLLVAVAALTLVACRQQEQQAGDQNVVIANGIDPNADVEALPPDESSATPTDQLANGADNPGVSDLNAATNSE